MKIKPKSTQAYHKPNSKSNKNNQLKIIHNIKLIRKYSNQPKTQPTTAMRESVIEERNKNLKATVKKKKDEVKDHDQRKERK